MFLKFSCFISRALLAYYIPIKKTCLLLSYNTHVETKVMLGGSPYKPPPFWITFSLFIIGGQYLGCGRSKRCTIWKSTSSTLFYPFYPFFWGVQTSLDKKTKTVFFVKNFRKLTKKNGKSYKKSPDFLLKLKMYLKYTLSFFGGKRYFMYDFIDFWKNIAKTIFFSQNFNFWIDGAIYVLFTLFLYFENFECYVHSFRFWNIFSPKFMLMMEIMPKIKSYFGRMCTF